MAATESSMLELGTKLPNFKLIDTVTGQEVASDKLNTKANLIMFICNHCPYVKHINSELSKLGKDYLNKDVSILAISSNDVENYPEDSPEKMKLNALEQGFSFPYLYDSTQEVAKQFKAECTPDFFIFNNKKELVYRGQFDDSRPGNGIPVSGKDVRNAIDALLSDKLPNENQIPSIGCIIKWK